MKRAIKFIALQTLPTKPYAISIFRVVCGIAKKRIVFELLQFMKIVTVTQKHHRDTVLQVT